MKLRLSPWTEIARAKLIKSEHDGNVVTLVLSVSRPIVVQLLERDIINGSVLSKCGDGSCISILRTDNFYLLKCHSQDFEHHAQGVQTGRQRVDGVKRELRGDYYATHERL